MRVECCGHLKPSRYLNEWIKQRRTIFCYKKGLFEVVLVL